MIRQRLDKPLVHVTEDGTIGADAEGYGENGNGGEPGVVAELAETVAAIGDHGGQPVAKSFLANLFFHLFDTPKLDSPGALPFLRGHAPPTVLSNPPFIAP